MEENKNQRNGALEEGQTDQNVISNTAPSQGGFRRTLLFEVAETPVASEADQGKAQS